MTEKKNVLVRVSAKAAKEGAGFTDPATGFTISPGQVKPLGPRAGVLTRARLASGFLLKVEQPPAAAMEPEPKSEEAPPLPPAPADKRKGFFRGQGK